MDSTQNKKAFNSADKNQPEFLNKMDEIVYSRGRKSFEDVRKKIMRTDKKAFVWGPRFDDKKIDLSYDSDPLKKGFSFFSVGLFTFSLVLMISAIVYSYYSFTTGGYTVRQDKIVLNLEIPTLSSAGQDINGQIVVGNENRTIFEDAYVTLSVEDKPGEKPKILNQIDVGDVDVGNKIYKNVTINLSGLEGERKKVLATLYYKIPQTESTFQKISETEVLITKSPVVMSVTGPQVLSVNQDGEYTVSVRGISKVIPTLLLDVGLPKQMKILKANFPLVGKNIYSLGPINEGDERVFKFTGSFKDELELGEKFTINVKAGQGEGGDVKAYFAENTYGISLSKNPIKIELVGEGQNGGKISFSSKQPKLSLVLTNTGNVRVKDVDLEVKFGGGLFIPKSVTIDGADYDSTRLSAVADGASNEQLREIDPGEQIVFPILFSEIASVSDVSGRNLKIDVILSSKQEDSDGKPAIQRVGTVLSPREGTSVAMRTMYFSGAFKNLGPMPPEVGKTTSYTVELDVDTNAGFNNGKFILPLSSNVNFIKSLDNTVSYNKDNKTLTWTVGSLSKATSTAFGVSRKQTSIQLSILPNPDQVRTAPNLTTGARFEAQSLDKSNFTITAQDASINISTDPKYELNKGYDSVSE